MYLNMDGELWYLCLTCKVVRSTHEFLVKWFDSFWLQYVDQDWVGKIGYYRIRVGLHWCPYWSQSLDTWTVYIAWVEVEWLVLKNNIKIFDTRICMQGQGEYECCKDRNDLQLLICSLLQLVFPALPPPGPYFFLEIMGHDSDVATIVKSIFTSIWPKWVSSTHFSWKKLGKKMLELHWVADFSWVTWIATWVRVESVWKAWV